MLFHNCDNSFRNLPPSQGGRYAGFGNTVEAPKNDDNEFFSQFTSGLSTGLSSLTLNAGKFAAVAKENIVKVSSTAVVQATELTKTVNEKVKEGTLLETVSSQATTLGSKLGSAWSNLNSLWSGSEQYPAIKDSTSTSYLSKGGYNTLGDTSGNSNNENYGNNNLFR